MLIATITNYNRGDRTIDLSSNLHRISFEIILPSDHVNAYWGVQTIIIVIDN